MSELGIGYWEMGVARSTPWLENENRKMTSEAKKFDACIASLTDSSY